MEANWIDIFCGSVLLVLTGLGLYFGLAKTLVHLLAWLGGALGVIYAPEFFGPFLESNFEFSETATVILSRVLGFLLPFIALRILGHFINKFIKRHLSLPNALAGGALGLVKGLIPCLVLLSTLYLLPLTGDLEKTRDRSVSYAVYTRILQSSGAEEKLQNAQDSLQSRVSDKVNETLDSAKTRARESAEKAVRETVEEAVQKRQSGK